MKFLIDECLSPDLAAIARDRGFYQSMHVTWLGLRSKKDWTLVRRAVEDGYVIVTNNTTDFTPLVEREEVHAGLVCINIAPDRMSLEMQKNLFEYALDQLANEEPINEVLEITLTADGIIRATRYEWPSHS